MDSLAHNFTGEDQDLRDSYTTVRCGVKDVFAYLSDSVCGVGVEVVRQNSYPHNKGYLLLWNIFFSSGINQIEVFWRSFS